MSPILIQPRPNRTARAIGAGLANFGRNLAYKQELDRAREESERANLAYKQELDRAREESERARAQEQADREGDLYRLDKSEDRAQATLRRRMRSMPGPLRDMAAGPASGALQEDFARAKDIASRMSPEARQQFVAEFQQEQLGRILSEGAVSLRNRVRDATQTGVIGEEQGAQLYQSIDPKVFVQDPKAGLEMMQQVDKALEAATEQRIQEEQTAMTRAFVEQEGQEILMSAQRLPLDKQQDLAGDIQRLVYNANRMTPRQIETTLKGIRSRATPDDTETADPREKLYQDLVEQFVMEGVETGEGNRFTGPVMRQVSYPEAARLAEERVYGERRFDFIERPTQASQPPAGAFEERMMPGTVRTTAGPSRSPAPPGPANQRLQELLGQFRKEPVDRQTFLTGDMSEADMRRAVAEMAAKGVNERIARERLGLDFDTLTEADREAIKRMVQEIRGGQ